MNRYTFPVCTDDDMGKNTTGRLISYETLNTEKCYAIGRYHGREDDD